MAEIHGKWLKTDSVNDTKVLARDTFWIRSSTGNIIRTNAGKVEMGAAPVWGTAPAAGDELVNKDYVDAAVFGLRDMKDAVRLATIAALPACTASVTTKVGKTLTADANGALSVDGIAVGAGDRILVKNQVAQADNGIYDVTATGDGSNPFVLTRSTDADENAEVSQGMSTLIVLGSQAQCIFALNTADPIDVDVTGLNFVEVPNPSKYFQPVKQLHTVSGSTPATDYDISISNTPESGSLLVRVVDGPILLEGTISGGEEYELSSGPDKITINGGIISSTQLVNGDQIEIMYGH